MKNYMKNHSIDIKTALYIAILTSFFTILFTTPLPLTHALTGITGNPEVMFTTNKLPANYTGIIIMNDSYMVYLNDTLIANHSARFVIIKTIDEYLNEVPGAIIHIYCKDHSRTLIGNDLGETPTYLPDEECILTASKNSLTGLKLYTPEMKMVKIKLRYGSGIPKIFSIALLLLFMIGIALISWIRTKKPNT